MGLGRGWRCPPSSISCSPAIAYRWRGTFGLARGRTAFGIGLPPEAAAHGLTPASNGLDVSVGGKEPAHSWVEAKAAAMAHLYRLASVVSLALDAEVVLRGEAVRFRTRRVGVPSVDAHTLDLPSWTMAALSRSEERRLADALAIRSEALALHRGHPSIALVCYVACIEAIAPPGDADICPACLGVRDSGKRFRSALARVSSTADVRAPRYYKKRSRTVHAGMLHAGETAFGWRMIGHLHPGSGLEALMDVERLRRTSRDLLVAELNGWLQVEA